MSSDLNLSINIGAIDSASAVFRSVGSAFKSLASGDIAGAATTAATAVVAVGAASVKMAADFQSGITSLATGAGESTSNLKMVSDGILGLAVSTGTSTQQLTAGMYMIESAGYHGAAGLQVLQAAAEGAKVGNADLGVVANGVTTIMTDFANQNINATQATNTLVATVASGKTTMQALSSSLSSILPTASAAGVGLTDVMSAMATMTGEGVPAANAATYLRQTIMNLSAPSKGTSDALKSIGLSAQFVSDGIKYSLPNTLDHITDALKKKFPEGSLAYNEALTKIAGGSKQLQGILDLTGQHMYAFDSNFSQIDRSVIGTGTAITGFSQVQNTFNFKMQQAQQVVNTLMIRLGQNLLPIMTQLVGAIPGIVNQLQNWGSAIGTVITWINKHQDVLNIIKAAFLTIAIQIASIVIPAFISFAVTAIGAAVGVIIAWLPFIAAFALVTAVIYGIIEVIQHWGQITAWLKGVWGGISSWFSGVLTAVKVWFVWLWTTIQSDLFKAWQAIQNAVKVALNVLVMIVMGPIFAIAGFFVWLYNHNTYFKMLVDAITNFIKAGIAWLQSAWQTVITWIVAQWNALVAFATNLWNQIAKAVQTAWNAAVGFVIGVWQKISAAFSAAWSTYIVGPLTALWNNVSSVFANAWNTYIAGPIGGIWNQISTWFTNLGTAAMNSGINFIKMLVNGIASGAGWIWNAVVNIANTIWRALGFHSPAKEGPGADADKWMPNLVNMLSSSLIAGVPKIQAAVNLVAKPLAALGTPQATTGPVAAPATTTNNGGDIAIHVHLGDSGTGTDAQRRGKDIADVVKRELAKTLRQQSIAPRYTSGGTHS